MKDLVLSFDYELFGDGSGDVFEDIINPTKRILDLCEVYNIKSTIFFEAIEYIKLKMEWDKGNSMGYVNNPIEAIEKQIINAALSGHDIQLHIHPQWFNAKYINNKWEVDLNNWRLGNFNNGSKYGIKSLLEEGKNSLENLIRSVIPNYKCMALRAGGYNITPSDEVYSAMKELNLKIDSSIYPGGYENGHLSDFDYHDVPLNLDYWWVDSNDIRRTSINQIIIEFPIFALNVYRFYKLLNLSKIKSLIFRNGYISPVNKEKIGRKNTLEKIKYLGGKESVPWDFCIFSEVLHSKYFEYIERNLHLRNTFVLIGHPKDFKNLKTFKNFLSLTKKRKIYSFKTLIEKYGEIVQ
jgi:hypothetical protein